MCVSTYFPTGDVDDLDFWLSTGKESSEKDPSASPVPAAASKEEKPKKKSSKKSSKAAAAEEEEPEEEEEEGKKRKSKGDKVRGRD